VQILDLKIEHGKKIKIIHSQIPKKFEKVEIQELNIPILVEEAIISEIHDLIIKLSEKNELYLTDLKVQTKGISEEARNYDE